MKQSDSARLISLMFIIGRRMRDEANTKEQKGAGSMLHFEVLRYIERETNPSMRDIAKYFMVTPPAATLLIDGLVANKFLRRIIDVKDRRAVRVTLTPKGKQALTHGIQDRIKKIKQVFSVLDAKEHAELVRILGKIAKISPPKK